MVDSRYSLQDQLGRGNMGVVYRAYDHLTGKMVALKRLEADPTTVELRPEVASGGWQHVVLAREFRLIAALRHPNIISVLDYGFTAEKIPFFVMELLESPRTLFEAAQELDTKGKVDLLIQMLQAITYLHRHKVLHRDLKPSNVIVTRDGLVKVLDFGIAVRQGEEQEFAGTVFYMAPEFLMGENAEEASDLFAVGVIAYELFTGLRPFTGRTFAEVTQRILTAAPNTAPLEELAQADPMITPITEVILCLLEKDPIDRYPDALETIKALCQAMGEPLPPDEGAIRESFLQAAKFVGREAEFNRLKTALEESKDVAGSLWFIGGESGIGKSRLLEELRIHALPEGIRILRGQAAEGDPYHLWGEAMRPLLLSLKISDEEASVLKSVIPDIDTLLERDVCPVPFDAHELSYTIGQMLYQIQRPTLLILEDLHWGSVEPLQLLPQVDQLPLMIVGSYRRDETPHLPDGFPHANVMILERLTTDAIEELSSSILGKIGGSRRILELLEKETEGNAFFIVEVVRAWAEEVGLLSEVGQITLPEMVFTGGIQKIIQRRLRQVPSWAFDGLQVAAIMGRQLNLNVLDRILSPVLNLITGKEISVSISTVWREERGLTLNDWLLVCADAAIIEVYEDGWRFTHNKLREQLLADMDPQKVQFLRKHIDRAAAAR